MCVPSVALALAVLCVYCMCLLYVYVCVYVFRQQLLNKDALGFSRPHDFKIKRCGFIYSAVRIRLQWI